MLLTDKLNITFTLVWTLVLANVAGAAALLLWGSQVSKVTYLQGHIIVPAILLFVFMGAWVGAGSLGNWIMLLIFGVIGYFMKLGGWPRPPIVLGFVLGKIMEEAMALSMQTHGWGSFTRPIVLVIIALTVITVVMTVRKQRAKRREEEKAGPKSPSETGVAEEGGKLCPPHPRQSPSYSSRCSSIASTRRPNGVSHRASFRRLSPSLESCSPSVP